MIYQDLYNTAYNGILGVCTNVNNYASIASEFKAGYSRNITEAKATATLSIVNPINQVSSSTISSQFQQHLVTYGVDLNNEVDVEDATGLINFYTALASFVSAKVCIAGGNESDSKYIIYNENGSAKPYTIIDPLDVIRANDNLTTTRTINQIIASNIKAYIVRYNLSI